MPMEFLVPSLCVALMTYMTKKGALEKRLDELMKLEEDIIIVGFRQQVQKGRQRHGMTDILRKRDFNLAQWY